MNTAQLKLKNTSYNWCAEIVETTFVVLRFSDIRKETTSFLVQKETTRNNPHLVSHLQGTTRNEIITG